MDRVVLQILEYKRVLTQSLGVELLVDFDRILVTIYNETARSLESQFAHQLTELMLVLKGIEVLAGQMKNLGVKLGPQVVSYE